MKEHLKNYLRAFFGYELKMYVISSEEMDPFIKEEIESYRKDFNFTVLTVRHSDKYKLLYSNMEEAEYHYNKAHKNLFNLLQQQITARTIVVIPSMGLAKNTLRKYVDPLVARNQTVIFPQTEYIKDNNLVLITAVGLTNHSQKFSAAQYHQLSLDDTSQMLKTRAILAMEIAKPYYAINQKYAAEQEAYLEETANRATFVAVVVTFVLGLTMLNFLKRMRVGRRAPEHVPHHGPSHADLVLAEANRMRQQREERDQVILEDQKRRDQKKRDKLAKAIEPANDENTVTLVFSTSPTKLKKRRIRRHSTELTAHLATAEDEVNISSESETHDFGPQSEKILGLLQTWNIDELVVLASFLKHEVDSGIRGYGKKEMLAFLGKFGCGLTENKTGRAHSRVTLPDGVSFMPLLIESNDTKHKSTGNLNGWAFKHLLEAFDNLAISVKTIDDLIAEKKAQALANASKGNGSPRCSAYNSI